MTNGMMTTGAGTGAGESRRSKRRLASLLVTSAVIGLATGLAPMQASAQSAAPAATGSQAIAFSIPAQPLPAAINAFIGATGWQISYSSALARGKKSAAVTGTMTPAQALQRLVAGTGLQVRIGAPGSAALVDPATAGAAASGDGTTVLDVIDVTAGGGTTASDLPFASPGSVAHISGAQIERLPPTSVGDIFRNTPGVNATGNRVGASMDLNIRGLQGQSRVNVMVDGTRQSNGSYRGYRGSRSEVYVDPDLLAGVDINKGPYSGAGGTGAMGGVVNMRTITARDIVADGKTYGARLKGSLGSNTESPQARGSKTIRDDGSDLFNGDAWTGNLAAGVVEDNYEFVAALARRQQGNYFAGKNGSSTYVDDRVVWQPPSEKRFSPFGPGQEVFNTSQDVTTLLTKGKVKWGDGQSLELGYIRYNNKYGENNETVLGFALSPFLNIKAEQFGLSETTTNTFTSTYKYNPEGNDYIDLTANLWASDVDTYSETLRAFTLGSGADGKTRVRTYGGDVSNRTVVETGFGVLTLNNGLEFVDERARENQTFLSYPNTPPIYASVNANGDRLLLSAFNQTRLDVTDWLRLEGSVRYDSYEGQGKGEILGDLPAGEASRVNPSGTVTVTPLDGLQVFASYIEGWRPPSLREWSAVGAGGLVHNAYLKPEISKNVEFGFNVKRDDLFRTGDAFRLKAVYFDNNYDDYIIRGRNQEFIYTWSNIDKAKFRGYELSAMYDTGSYFVEAGFTKYDDIRFCGSNSACGDGAAATDYGITNVPPKYSGTVTAGARLFDQRLTVGTRVYSFGERFGGYGLAPGAVNPPTVWTKSTIVDLFGSYKVSQDVTLDFSAENLGDRYYMDPMSTGAIPSPGRTIRAGLTAKF